MYVSSVPVVLIYQNPPILSHYLHCLACKTDLRDIGLISYSEATRYTPQKRLEAELWCEQHNKRLGQHLLYPRTKGFIACVQQLRQAPHVKAVYDVTIAYARIRTPSSHTNSSTTMPPTNGAGPKMVNGAKAARGIEFMVPPTFLQTVLTPRLDREWRFFVHLERFAIEDLPQGEEDLAAWLEERWVEKGERLERSRGLLVEGREWDEKCLLD